MSKAVKIRNIRIKTVDDLKHAKQLFRYEAKVNEQALLTGFSHFGDLMIISARNSLEHYGRRVLIHALLRLWKSRRK